MTDRVGTGGGSMNPRAPMEGAGVGGHYDNGGGDAADDLGTPFPDKPNDSKFLRIAQNVYEGSTDYMNSSLRRQFTKALDLFHNRHPAGSRYWSDSYAKRSRLFYPKIRSQIRHMEGAAALAFFSTSDVVQVSAANESDQMQRLGALVKNQVLNYRMNQKEVKWFLTCIGGAQDAMTVGTVISKQEWVFKERVERYAVPLTDEQGNIQTDPVTGETMMGEKEVRTVVRDHPKVKLITAENFRVDPACDWTDPVNSSPYVVELIPMYVIDVLDRMKPRKGDQEPRFRTYDASVIRAGAREDWDSIRQARDGKGRVDKYSNGQWNDYEIAWVRLNIVNLDGDDWVYWTLGDQIMLTDPKPISQVWLHGQRPYVMGYSIIEANRLYPAGIPALNADIAEGLNFLRNTRFDNIMLALNKRWFVRRGSGADLRALLRNVPGGAVVMNDPQTDVRPVGTPDVTSSSYQEQDRLNQDADDQVGLMANSTIESAKNLNETVGGMQLLSENTDPLKQLMMRTISETWVEPVLQQLVDLERFYESDMMVLQIACARAKAPDIATAFRAFMLPADVRVSVGFGSTSPTEKINKLMTALKTLFEAYPELAQMADWSEICAEVFGAVGYDDGSRFFPSLDQSAATVPMSQYQQLQQQLSALQAQLQGKQAEGQTKIAVETIRTQSRERIEGARIQAAMNKNLTEAQLKNQLNNMQQQKIALDAEIKAAANATAQKKLELEAQALDQAYQETMRDYALQVSDRLHRNRQAATTLTGANPNRQTGGALNKGAVRLPGDGEAGVVSRGHFGMVPGVAG